MDEQRGLLNRARAEDLFQQIQSGMSLADAAKEAGERVQKMSNLVRQDEAKSPLTPLSKNQIFEASVNAPLKLNAFDGFVVGQVTDITLPDVSKASKAIEEIQTMAQNNMAQEILSQYISTMSTRYKVRVNDRLINQMYGEAQ